MAGAAALRDACTSQQSVSNASSDPKCATAATGAAALTALTGEEVVVVMAASVPRIATSFERQKCQYSLKSCQWPLGIATEAFALPRPELNVPWYQFSVCAIDTRPLRAMGGITVHASGGLAALR